MPHFSPQGEHWALKWYYSTDVNATAIDLLITAIKRLFFTQEVINYYSLLLKPYAFLPILGWPWVVLAFPEIMINILSSHAQMLSIFLHYDSAIIPWLALATVFAIANGNSILKKIRLRSLWITAVNLILVGATFLLH